MKFSFTKYHGTGNDFIIIDDRQNRFPHDRQEQIAAICTRRFGIGADGLMLLRKHPHYDFEMRYFNADGKTSSMCGNGGRCIAHFAQSIGVALAEMTFIAIDGVHKATIHNQIVSLNMQDVNKVQFPDKHSYVLDTGSPHFVAIRNGVMSNHAFVSDAKKIRDSQPFAAQGINVNFIEFIDDREIAIRTYERGVEDETYSCGTGAVAAALTTALAKGLSIGQHLVKLQTKGGELQVSFNLLDDQQFKNISLTGPAIAVFSGEIEI